MSQFKRGSGWVAKFYRQGKQEWVPDGPWSTKAQARAAEAIYRAELEESVKRPETAGTWGDRFLVEFNRGVETQKQYEAAVKRFQNDFGRDVLLTSIDKDQARKWAIGVPKGVSAVITTMFNKAKRLGLVDMNPFSDMGLELDVSDQEIDSPTLEEYRAFLAACSVLGGYGPEMSRMIQFAAWTGMRQGEIFALRWKDIDEVNELIHVRQSRKRGGTIGLPKNKRTRKILLPPPAQVLDEQEPKEDCEFVFHSPTGKPLVRGTFGHHWEKVKAAAKIGDRYVAELRVEDNRLPIRWHDWRHFCATQALEMGVDHAAVAIQLGHRDGGALVMKRYGHPSHDRARDRLKMAFGAMETGSQTGSTDALRQAGRGN